MSFKMTLAFIYFSIQYCTTSDPQITLLENFPLFDVLPFSVFLIYSVISSIFSPLVFLFKLIWVIIFELYYQAKQRAENSRILHMSKHLSE